MRAFCDGDIAVPGYPYLLLHTYIRTSGRAREAGALGIGIQMRFAGPESDYYNLNIVFFMMFVSSFRRTQIENQNT